MSEAFNGMQMGLSRKEFAMPATIPNRRHRCQDHHMVTQNCKGTFEIRQTNLLCADCTNIRLLKHPTSIVDNDRLDCQ